VEKSVKDQRAAFMSVGGSLHDELKQTETHLQSAKVVYSVY